MLLTPRARLCRYNASESVRPSPPGSTAAFGTGISVRARGGIRASQCARAVLDDELQRAQSDQALAYDGPGREYGPVGPKGAKVEKVAVERIRNFSIIAHIDHGKSTLADRLLMETGTVEARKMMAQFLDGMDLERERGITIKLNTARMKYKADDGETYCLNLIDTPGHVDFSYEVSRSLAACEGALLVVDASQGVEAQTLANVWLAIENNLTIIPIINKIDLPGADVEKVKAEIEEVIGLDCSNALLCSAKTGVGIEAILESIVKDIPAPKDTRHLPPRALIFDSYYDQYVGIVCQFRVMDGMITKRDTIHFINTGKDYALTDIWIRAPDRIDVDCLYAGEVGCVAAGIKSVLDARVGDTITLRKMPGITALPGYTEVQPQVFCGLFPIDADDYPALRDSLGKLQLNDAALSFEPEVSSAMGYGFRCGFLGMLHMDIVQERLEREHNLNLITTAPTVVYRCLTTAGEEIECSNCSDLPDSSKRQSISEPYVKMDVITPKEYVGTLMELCQKRRGVYIDMAYLTEERTTLQYEMPLAEVVTDFFDEMKSRSKGYASMDYQFLEYRENDLVKLEIRINGELAEPLATICHRDNAYAVGKGLVSKLKELIPRQQFKVPIQATIGNKAIAAESIAAMRKDVLAKCYGGDITRKKKLLSKQAEGKKRMKSIGRVDIPQEAFMAVLSAGRD